MTHSAGYVQSFPHYRIRQTAQASQPRYVVAKRLNSVRLNWFMLGSVAGVVICFTFNMLVGGMLQGGSLNNALPSLKTALSIESDAPVAQTAEPELVLEAATAEPVLAIDTPPLEEEATYPKTVSHTLKKGETLANILTDHELPYQQAHAAIMGLKKTYDPRNLRPGQTLNITLDQNAQGELQLSQLEIEKNRIESVMLSRTSKGFAANAVKQTLAPELTLAGGTINNSLFETGYANGIPDGVLAELMQAYSYDVDFQREIQRGDQVEVLFEKLLTEEGEEAGYGDIVYATLKLRGKPISIYRHEDKDGFAGFYTEKGESVRKALLKTPINGARISSGYGKRKHPILGYSKMHTGTDFAARTGTPIYAAGDGTVTFKGRKGGYGNYIQIKHNGSYQSAYAHMSRFASGMKNGKKVKQGQVIGYVGSTGRSTGPHLHYEIIKNGRKVNPMGEKFKTGKVLKGTELANFKSKIGKIKQQVASMPKAKTTLAKAE